MPKFKPLFWWALAGVVFTVLVYTPVFRAEFLSWDDRRFILDNPLLTQLNWANIKAYFTGFFMEGYYPLTLLSLALDYQIQGFNPLVFHAGNLILHLLNALLVYLFIHRLTGNQLWAGIVSLLFAVHPLQVESVAWITERKDVLYTCFLLLSLIVYLKYQTSNRWSAYWLVVGLFLLALLSKGQAVILLPLLYLVDYYRKRNWNVKTLLLEKIPFFVLASVFAWVAVRAGESGQMISSSHGSAFSFLERLVFACYALCNYAVKIIFPFELSAYYPYPVKPGEILPFSLYLYLIPVLAFLGLMVWAFRRRRQLFFGLAFFLVALLPVLKLIPITDALMADRYTYVASIGGFFLLGNLVAIIPPKHSFFTQLAKVILMIYVMLLSAMSFQRARIWQNSEALFGDLVKKYPNEVLGWNNLGNAKKASGNLRAAVNDYTVALNLNPDYALGYLNRGVALHESGQLIEALKDYDRSLALDSINPTSWYNRGVVHNKLLNYSTALADLNRAISLDTTFAAAYSDRGNARLHLGETVPALHDYARAIQLNPLLKAPYFNRARVKQQAGDQTGALLDYNMVLKRDPMDRAALLNRGTVFLGLAKFSEAIKDYALLARLEPNLSGSWYNLANAYYQAADFEAAVANFNKALELEPTNADLYNNRGSARFMLKDYEGAVSDYTMALRINPYAIDARNNRGNANYEAGHYQHALADFSFVIEQHPDLASAWLMRGRTHQALGKTQKGRRDLEKAMALGEPAAAKYLK